MLLDSEGADWPPLYPARPTSLSAEVFARLMAELEPFEPMPHLAVGVSGGADSLALCLLAQDWAAVRGGRVTALTLDHRLRAESADEAAQVGAWLLARGIEHRVLVWQGDKPRTGIQAAAREARRRILGEWCRLAGVLHLLLAHHQADQEETFRLREERSSGPTGLAAMAAVVESEWGRVLRPVLSVPPDSLRAVLLALGQPWIEDPSNRNPAFARTRLRRTGGGDGRAGAEARRLGLARVESDRAVADFLARNGEVFDEGYCRLSLEALREATAPVRARAVERTLMTVSGHVYPPRGDRLDRLLETLAEGGLGRGRTLGGCRLIPDRDGLLVVREPAAVEGPAAVAPGTSLRWDGRFRIRLDGRPLRGGAPPTLRIAALGSDAYAKIRREDPRIGAHGLPRVVAQTLPALWDLDGVLAVPHLSYGRQAAYPDSVNALVAGFFPAHPLAGAGFGVCLPKTGLDGGAAG